MVIFVSKWVIFVSTESSIWVILDVKVTVKWVIWLFFCVSSATTFDLECRLAESCQLMDLTLQDISDSHAIECQNGYACDTATIVLTEKTKCLTFSYTVFDCFKFIPFIFSFFVKSRRFINMRIFVNLDTFFTRNG